jgi:hypothetical protein
LVNRAGFGIKHPHDLISILQAVQGSIRRLEKLEYVLLFALFLSCTTSYRIPVGSTTISPAEIFSWLFILWRWTVGGTESSKLGRGVRRLIWAFRAFAVYAGILWFFSNDWLLRREMFTDWLLAALLIDCLLRSPWRNWKPVAALFVLAALPNGVWGVLQHVMGIGLMAKDLSGWGRNAASFPIMGFFGWSNDLAVYLYWPLLACVGLAAVFRSWRRIPFLALALLYSLVMYWTISRSTFLTLGFAAIITLFLLLFRRRRQFLLAMAILIGLAALGLAWILHTKSLAWINYTLSGRLDLWNQGLQIIVSDKYLLPFGYLSIPPPNLRYWWLPHNIYTLSWIEFGIPGFLFLIGLGGFFLYAGWKRYEKLRIHFPATALWTGLAGLFLINGMASLYFHEPYVIVNFLCAAAIWLWQIREIDLPPSSGDSSVPQTENGSVTARVVRNRGS